MQTIHYICRGNAHRSVMAEAYTKSLRLQDVRIVSSGTVADRSRAKNEAFLAGLPKVLEPYGVVQFIKARPEQLTQARLNEGDITIFMNQIAADECATSLHMPANTFVWDITDAGEGAYILQPGDDPYKFTPKIYGQIRRRVDALVASLGLRPLKPTP